MSEDRTAGDHDRLRPLLGAHLLGGLPAEEDREVRDHLATCAACRAERDELLPTVQALAEVRRAGPADLPDNPPADLGSRVLAGVVAEADRAARDATAARRRSWLRAASLSAVGAAAAAVVLVAGLALTRPGEPAPPAVPLEAVGVVVEQPGVRADADLVAHTWGVEVKLHGSGFEPGARYRVVVLATDGTRNAAGEFVGTGSREMDCNLNSAVLRDRAAGFEVRDSRGRLVVSSRFV